VRLIWWEGVCAKRDQRRSPIHWATDQPIMHDVTFECLGAISQRKHYFDIHGIINHQRLPSMNHAEQDLLLDVLKRQLQMQTGLEVGRIKRHLIDWEASVDLF